MNVIGMRSRSAEAERFLKSIGNRHQLLILRPPAKGGKSVAAPEEGLGMRQLHLSQHQARLRRDGLARTRRAARSVFGSGGSEAAQRTVGILHGLCCARGALSPQNAGKAPPADAWAPDGRNSAQVHAQPVRLQRHGPTSREAKMASIQPSVTGVACPEIPLYNFREAGRAAARAPKG